MTWLAVLWHGFWFLAGVGLIILGVYSIENTPKKLDPGEFQSAVAMQAYIEQRGCLLGFGFACFVAGVIAIFLVLISVF